MEFINNILVIRWGNPYGLESVPYLCVRRAASPQTTWCHLISINNRYNTPTHSSRQPTISPCESFTRTTNIHSWWLNSDNGSGDVISERSDIKLRQMRDMVRSFKSSTPHDHPLPQEGEYSHASSGRLVGIRYLLHHLHSAAFLLVASEWCGYIIHKLSAKLFLWATECTVFKLQVMNILKLHFSDSHEWRAPDNGQSYLLDSWTRI